FDRMTCFGLGTPANLIKLVQVLIIHQSTSSMPDAHSIIHSKPRARSRRQNVLPIRTPFADTSIRCLDGGDLLVILLQIVDVHLSCKVAESRHEYKTTMWR